MSCFWFKVIIAGVLLVDRITGTPNNDSNSRFCSDFTYSTIQKTYRPSEIINISASCNMTTECPTWNIISEPAEIRVLQNETVVTNHSCTRNVYIQVINFRGSAKRIQLLVDFSYPRREGTWQINVEKSDNGEKCYLDEDCYEMGQLCSQTWGCMCPWQFTFVTGAGRCFPVISRYYGRCEMTEQCRAYKSICKDSSCQCPDHHFPDGYFFNCLPDARSLGEECATDENCGRRDSNSWCISNHCACKTNYFNYLGVCKSFDYPASEASRIHYGWTGILLAVFMTSFRP